MAYNHSANTLHARVLAHVYNNRLITS